MKSIVPEERNATNSRGDQGLTTYKVGPPFTIAKLVNITSNSLGFMIRK